MADLADDEREEELSSITAIYPELSIDPASRFAASLDIPVAPSPPLAVRFPPPVDGGPPGLPTPPASDHGGRKDLCAKDEVHRLLYLPPLNVQITLPDGYPSERPPTFKLSTSPAWIPDATLQCLKDEGTSLWEEYGRGQVVFAYIDYLQQAAERGFDLSGADGPPLDVSLEMKIGLLDYDIKEKRHKFEQETFDCGVCLEPKKGSACYRLMRCGHVFCIACLQDFYNNCIEGGDVSSVRCPDPGCGKERGGIQRKRKSERTINPSELLQIPLEKEVVKRYVKMKRKKRLESDKTTIWCPRKWCQGPARSKKYPKIIDLTQADDFDSDSDEGGAKPLTQEDDPTKRERLCICEDCKFAYCRVCLASWHGDFVRCWPRNKSELSAEELASYNYIRRNTSPCPTCSSPCQKTHGCNHMQCFNCRSHFCYLCSSWLDPNNPYQHFNKEGTECHMRLWELEEGDEGNGDVGFQGARGWEVMAELAGAMEEEVPRDPLGRADGENANRPPAPPQAPEPPRAAYDPPLVAIMNDMQLHQNPQELLQVRRAQVQNLPQRRGRAGLPNADGIAGGARHEAAQMGLQRFLQLVQDDEEDGWDSDELDGEEDLWVIPDR